MYFPDVPTEYWAYGYIKYFYCQGVISGYSDGYFRPNNAIRRAEFSKLVVLAYGFSITTPTSPSFSDVPPSYWAYNFIETLHARSIISGYADGTFQPSALITRAQIVKIVVLASGTAQYTGLFTDYPDVPPSYWAYQFIKTASHLRWVGGYEDGNFRPNNNASRAELAKTLYLAIVFPNGSR